MLELPIPLLDGVTDSGSRITSGVNRVAGDVGGRGGVTGGTGSGLRCLIRCCVACRSVRRKRGFARLSHLQLTSYPRSTGFDSRSRTMIFGVLLLKARENALGAVRCPNGKCFVVTPARQIGDWLVRHR